MCIESLIQHFPLQSPIWLFRFKVSGQEQWSSCCTLKEDEAEQSGSTHILLIFALSCSVYTIVCLGCHIRTLAYHFPSSTLLSSRNSLACVFWIWLILVLCIWALSSTLFASITACFHSKLSDCLWHFWPCASLGPLQHWMVSTTKLMNINSYYKFGWNFGKFFFSFFLFTLY